MKLTTGILLMGIAAGSAWAQNPDIIENTRNTMKAVEQKKAIDSNAALAYSASQSSAPAASMNGKPAMVAAKPSITSKPAAAPAKPAKAGKSAVVAVKAQPKVKVAAVKSAKSSKPAAAKKAAEPKQTVAVEAAPNPDAKKEKKDEAKAINITGQRDPFVSPVVNRSMTGSGCSTGKRCLAIDQIALKGVVKSDTGMIAVVVNALDKAYFLRENDPVFNGYVVKITGDSIVFKETLQDKLGKAFTREVTKKITTPAV
jgi:Tfp pilus assembly protein PilP